jgi:histidyl-tRNA synthetase
MAVEVLRGFDLPKYHLALNNRKILDAQVRVAGIPPEKKLDALRALDKLHKIGKDGVRDEFVRYGLTVEQFERFFHVIVVDTLAEAKSRLVGDEVGQKGVAELEEIFDKAGKLGFAGQLSFDWTLARGLDYYTGPIFEARAESEAGFGSFGAGGRYDDLIALYGGQPQGAVGISFGVERLIGLLEERGGKVDTGPLPLLVAAVESEAFEGAVGLCRSLRHAGVPVRFVGAMKRDKAFKYSTATGLSRLVLVAAGDVQAGVFALRDAGKKEEQRLSVDALIEALRHG